MTPNRSLWPAAVAAVVLLAIGVMILPGSDKEALSVLPRSRELQSWSWGSRTTFPDKLDDTDEWGHYAVVRIRAIQVLEGSVTSTPLFSCASPFECLFLTLFLCLVRRWRCCHFHHHRSDCFPHLMHRILLVRAWKSHFFAELGEEGLFAPRLFGPPFHPHTPSCVAHLRRTPSQGSFYLFFRDLDPL